MPDLPTSFKDRSVPVGFFGSLFKLSTDKHYRLSRFDNHFLQPLCPNSCRATRIGIYLITKTQDKEHGRNMLILVLMDALANTVLGGTDKVCFGKHIPAFAHAAIP